MSNQPARWRPRTESEILAAIEARVLAENHHFDAKEEVTENSRLAASMASFAQDGGGILIGLAEDKITRVFSLSPQPIEGLPERIELIARTRIDPPLYVTPHVIPSQADDGLGYVYIEIPPSPVAPHMSDNRYYGRNHATKTRLSDAEVRRAFARNQDFKVSGLSILQEERTGDNLDIHHRSIGHFFVVAQPLTAPEGTFVKMVREQVEVSALRDFVILEADKTIDQNLASWAPAPQYLVHTIPTASGVVFSQRATRGRHFMTQSSSDYPSKSLHEVLFREDGGVRVTVGRATTGPQLTATDPPRMIRDQAMIGHCLRVLKWVEYLGNNSGYRGSWMFGFSADGLLNGRGQAWEDSPYGVEGGYTYDEAIYEEVTTALLEEIANAPSAIAARLLGKLFRALGPQEMYQRLCQ